MAPRAGVLNPRLPCCWAALEDLLARRAVSPSSNPFLWHCSSRSSSSSTNICQDTALTSPHSRLPSLHSRLPSLHSCLPHHTIISLHCTVVSLHHTVVFTAQLLPFPTVVSLTHSCFPLHRFVFVWMLYTSFQHQLWLDFFSFSFRSQRAFKFYIASVITRTNTQQTRLQLSCADTHTHRGACIYTKFILFSPTDLGLWLGKTTAGLGDDGGEAGVDCLIHQFVSETREVLLELAQTFLAVWQQRQAERQISPMALVPVRWTLKLR